MNGMLKGMLPIALGTAMALPAASPVLGAVLMFGSGYAEECHVLATHRPDSDEATGITGSRIGLTPVEICTKAIVEENLVGTNLASTYNNRGVFLFAAGAYAEALEDFDRALAITTDIPDIHVNRGLALIPLQRWAESIPSFDRGIELQAAGLDRAYYNRATAHEETGNLRQAYLDYQKASELNPDWEEPKLQLQRFTVGGG